MQLCILDMSVRCYCLIEKFALGYKNYKYICQQIQFPCVHRMFPPPNEHNSIALASMLLKSVNLSMLFILWLICTCITQTNKQTLLILGPGRWGSFSSAKDDKYSGVGFVEISIVFARSGEFFVAMIPVDKISYHIHHPRYRWHSVIMRSPYNIWEITTGQVLLSENQHHHLPPSRTHYA